MRSCSRRMVALALVVRMAKVRTLEEYQASYATPGYLGLTLIYLFAATRIGAPHKSGLHGKGQGGLLTRRRSRRFLDVSSLNLGGIERCRHSFHLGAGKSTAVANGRAIRRDHQIVSVAVIIAVSVNIDGRRKVLGMTVATARPSRSGSSSCAS